MDWLVAFRDVTNATNRRTTIFTVTRSTAMSGKAPLLQVDFEDWDRLLPAITTAINDRTPALNYDPLSGNGYSTPNWEYTNSHAVSSSLVLANANSLPLDYVARLSVGSVSLSYFIVKQLPILRPGAYLKESRFGPKWFQLIVPRILALTYTSEELDGFAGDLGYRGSTFPFDEERRHRLRCELDAIYAKMYDLNRIDLEWLLDAQPPGSTFPNLKRHELKEFGEYRTQRYVLEAYDALTQGEIPMLNETVKST